MFFPSGFLMSQGSCFVHTQRFSHETGFMLCSFPEVLYCHRVHVLFFPCGFLMKQIPVLFFPRGFLMK